MHLPDLSIYDLYRVVEDSPVWNVVVPGLSASYFRRVEPGRTATAGVYAYQGVEVFVAWGYADERHCRFHAFRDRDGAWERARPGCPRVRAVQTGGRVTGLLLRTGSGDRLLPAASGKSRSGVPATTSESAQLAAPSRSVQRPAAVTGPPVSGWACAPSVAAPLVAAAVS